MKAKPGLYKGSPCYTLENDWISMVILPALGAKIASLVYKPQNFEVFFQPTGHIYPLPQYGADFSCYDTSGADEMYPTIDPCCYPAPGYSEVSLPDHGELWSIPWQVIADEGRVVSTAQGISLPYTFERVITLADHVVQISYRVRNTGQAKLYGLWAFHGLVACDQGTKLLLPQAERVINVHDSTVLGSVGTSHKFPLSIGVDGQKIDLSRIGPCSLRRTEKFYIQGKIAQGTAGLTLNAGKLLYQLSFPQERVPYLGVWINMGGFKGEYNCALEPASGYYDSLAEAYRSNSLVPLNPGENQEWYLNIELTAIK